jgi:hypothetical protein
MYVLAALTACSPGLFEVKGRVDLDLAPAPVSTVLVATELDDGGAEVGEPVKELVLANDGQFALTLRGGRTWRLEAVQETGDGLAPEVRVLLHPQGDEQVHVNLATTLSFERALALGTGPEALEVEEARARAEGELVSWLGLGEGVEPGPAIGLTLSEGADAGAAWLLGVGALLDEAAGVVQEREGRPVLPSELHATIADALGAQGEGPPELTDALAEAERRVDTVAREEAFARRAETLGLDLVTPALDRVFDSDGDGVVNLDDACPHVPGPHADADGDGTGDECDCGAADCLAPVERVALGDAHTCAAGPDGVWCWGRGFGPDPVALFLPGAARSVVAGGDRTCVVLEDTGGRPAGLWCWLAEATPRPTPVPIPALAEEWAAPGEVVAWDEVVVGTRHVCAHVASANNGGSLWCWGSNEHGELGQGTTSVEELDALPVSHPDSADSRNWAPFAAGDGFTCANAAAGDGDLYCWGRNDLQQCLQPTDVPSSATPLLARDGRFSALSARGAAACGLSVDPVLGGTAACWGDPAVHGREAADAPSPVDGVGLLSALSVGGAEVLAIDTGRRVWRWSGDAPRPALVTEDGRWLSVAAGGAHACAVDRERQLWCWGDDGEGQAGAGGGERVAAPTLVAAP